ncbi:hypothetical protein DFH06DRAFT_1395575 [Mycena polygramma]|nr:hypothetical protein DFH06DRAFT_1395575 [Mycena polygramma]
MSVAALVTNEPGSKVPAFNPPFRHDHQQEGRPIRPSRLPPDATQALLRIRSTLSPTLMRHEEGNVGPRRWGGGNSIASRTLIDSEIVFDADTLFLASVYMWDATLALFKTRTQDPRAFEARAWYQDSWHDSPVPRCAPTPAAASLCSILRLVCIVCVFLQDSDYDSSPRFVAYKPGLTLNFPTHTVSRLFTSIILGFYESFTAYHTRCFRNLARVASLVSHRLRRYVLHLLFTSHVPRTQ